jgi:hypothetical protein
VEFVRGSRIKYIGPYAFSSCPCLKSVKFSERSSGCTVLVSAFKDCDRLILFETQMPLFMECNVELNFYTRVIATRTYPAGTAGGDIIAFMTKINDCFIVHQATLPQDEMTKYTAMTGRLIAWLGG